MRIFAWKCAVCRHCCGNFRNWGYNQNGFRQPRCYQHGKGWRQKTWCNYIIIRGGVAAIIGHCFPIFLKFKGGKGVATTLGVYFAISPILGYVTLAIWLVVFALFRISSLSALAAMNLVPFFALIYFDQEIYHIVTALGLFISWRHTSNIKKLLEGSEN